MRLRLSLPLLAFAAAAGAQSPNPPILGKWLGVTGFPTDSIVLGFEIKYNDKHELKAYLYEPVLNFYPLELPGLVEEDSGVWRNRQYPFAFRKIVADTIFGTFFPFLAPMRLTRTDTFPKEQPIPALPTGPGPKWRLKLDAPIYAPVATRDSFAYVGTTGGVFHAVNTHTGKLAWLFRAGRPMFGEALTTDSAIYFVCDNGYLFKLDRASGAELWRYDLGGERVDRILPSEVTYEYDYKGPRPTLFDGVIYVGSADGSLHAVTAQTGVRRWRFEAANDSAGMVRATAIVHGGLVIFGSMSGMMFGVDRTTGRERWRKQTGAQITSDPAIIGGRLIVGNHGGLLAALNPDSGTRIWRMILWGSATESNPIDDDGMILIGASDLRRVSRIDPKDGKVLWRTDVYGWAWSRPLIVGDVIYEGAASGIPYQMRHVSSFTAMDRKSGKILWRWEMPAWEGAYMNGFAAGAALADGIVVAGGVDGSLYGFEAGRR